MRRVVSTSKAAGTLSAFGATPGSLVTVSYGVEGALANLSDGFRIKRRHLRW